MSTASVIVPTRGPARRLERLLGSLADQTAEHELLVVDNGSPGAAVARCCESFGVDRPIRLERNAGFSAAVNLAAARASGEALVLVNDDCTVEPRFVEELVAALDAPGSVAMAAGILRSATRPELIDTAGLTIDHTLLVDDHLNGEPFTVLEGDVPDPIGPSGAAAAFDRGAFLACGGFDERLFAYWEDADLALRLAREGASCRLAKGAVGVHEHSGTLGHGSRAKNRLTGFGRGYVLRKWNVVTPRRLVPVAARELLLMAGQLAADRSLAGLAGRIAGWRAATPSEPYPERLVAASSHDPLLAMLRRRNRRRRAPAAG